MNAAPCIRVNTAPQGQRSTRLVKVGISGIAASIIDVAVLIVLVEQLEMLAPGAAFIGAISGAGVNFIINKYWAFDRHTRSGFHQLITFALVAIVTALLVAIGVHLFATVLGASYLVAKAIAATLTFLIWGYPAQAKFVFPPKPVTIKNASSLATLTTTLKLSSLQTKGNTMSTIPNHSTNLPTNCSDRPIDLSVIVPAFNEEERIGPTLADLDNVLAAMSIRYQILVVDDGSSDGTAALVTRMARKRQSIHLMRTFPNRGKGHAVRVGMLAAAGAVRLMSDADGSMPASEIGKLYQPVAGGKKDIVLGSRWAGNHHRNSDQPIWRRLWSRTCNYFIQRTVVAGVADTQCGFKAFSASAATALFSRATINGWAFDLEILALASRLGYSMAEVPVEWTDDERSKINPIQDFIKVIREWITIRKNLSRDVYQLREAGGQPMKALS